MDVPITQTEETSEWSFMFMVDREAFQNINVI